LANLNLYSCLNLLCNHYFIIYERFLFILFFLAITVTSYGQKITSKNKLFRKVYYLDHQQISKTQLRRELYSYPSTTALLRKSRTQQKWGIAASLASIGFAIWHLNGDDPNNLSTVPNLLAAGMAAMAFYLGRSSGIQWRSAIRKYNSLNDTGFKINFGFTTDGIGLACTF